MKADSSSSLLIEKPESAQMALQREAIFSQTAWKYYLAHCVRRTNFHVGKRSSLSILTNYLACKLQLSQRETSRSDHFFPGMSLKYIIDLIEIDDAPLVGIL